MTWLILTVAASIATAFCVFFDNYLTDVFFKGKLAQAQKMFYAPAYALTAFILFLLFPIEAVPIIVALMLIAAGIISSISAVPYYIALEKDDTTNITLLQQFAPIFYLIFGRFILGESISGGKLLAFLIVLSAPLLIIFTSRRHGKNTEIKTAGFVLTNVAIAALAHTIAAKAGADCDSITMIFYLMIGKVVGDGILLAFNKKWRDRFKYVSRRYRKSFGYWSSLTADHLLYIIHEFTYYTALVMAPTIAIVPAVLKTITPIFVFFFGVILSILWPSFGREKVTKKSITIRLIATTLAAVGVALMQML